MKTFKSSRLLAGLYLTKVIFRDRIIIDDTYVTIKKRKWFGLMLDEEQVKIKNIASVRVTTGFFSSRVRVETLGGASEDLYIHRVWKRTALKIKHEIQSKEWVV